MFKELILLIFNKLLIKPKKRCRQNTDNFVEIWITQFFVYFVVKDPPGGHNG